MPNERDHALVVTVAYDGAPFAGFARQPGLTTVQGCLEAALSTTLRRAVETVGAGRTDAGVHALGQVVSCDGYVSDPEQSGLRRSLDALSGEGISVRAIRYARSGFSARFDAESREYRYRIVQGSAAPVFTKRFAWHVARALDVDAIREAIPALLGEHDFKSFCVTESAQGKRTMRRLDVVELLTEEHLGEECLCVRIVGNAFLHSMVRVLVGSLVEVGSGRHASGWIAEALAAADRRAAGPTAPAHGLTLHEVRYPEDVWL